MTPEIYTRIVEKKPEAAVPGLRHIEADDLSGWEAHDGFIWRPLVETEAHALILAHWLDMLPEGHGLHGAIDNPKLRYYVYGGGVQPAAATMTTPLDALAAWLERTA